MRPPKNRLKVLCLLTALTLLMTACQTGGPKKEETGAATFFPIPPDAPRVQYLTWFAGEEELSPREEQGAFASFIVGKDRTKRERLRKPYGVTARNGVIYVCDADRAIVAEANLKNKTFKIIGASGKGKLQKPINVAVDKLGYKFVADAIRNEVVVFDPDNKCVAAYQVPGEKCRVVDVALHDNDLYVLNNLGAQIVVLDRTDGKVKRTIGKRGIAPGEFNLPSSIAISPDNHLYVSDPISCRIQKLTLEGKPVWDKGGPGFYAGQFGRPRDIFVGPNNIVYITDAATAIVQMWDADGNVLMHLGGSGYMPGSLVLPSSTAIDPTAIPYFKDYIHKDFQPEYLIFVANQYGDRLVSVYAFGAFPEGYKFKEGEFKTVPIIPTDEEELPADPIKEKDGAEPKIPDLGNQQPKPSKTGKEPQGK